MRYRIGHRLNVSGDGSRPSISPTILQADSVSTVAGTTAAILSRHCGTVFIGRLPLSFGESRLPSNDTFRGNARETNRGKFRPLITFRGRLNDLQGFREMPAGR